MTNKTMLPDVEQLARELATGQTPVELYEAYTAAAAELSPVLNPISSIKPELRARIQFAWEFARAASIKNRVKT